MNGYASWFYLLIAATFEACWTLTLKTIQFADLKTLRWNTFYRPDGGLPVLLPFIGYVLFGLGNIYFFTLALKQVPTATAFAVWMSLALILLKLIDVFYFKNHVSAQEIFFLMLITVGIVGLKVYSTP